MNAATLKIEQMEKKKRGEWWWWWGEKSATWILERMKSTITGNSPI